MGFVSDGHGSSDPIEFTCSSYLGHDTPHVCQGQEFRHGTMTPWALAWGAPCEHEWTSARNEAVESGMVCPKCWAVRQEQPWEATDRQT